VIQFTPGGERIDKSTFCKRIQAVYDKQSFAPIDRSAARHAADRGKKIAVIGTGISGLSAAWLLHPHHDIAVYEQNDYVGGHSDTVDITVGGTEMSVDTGFIVYNPVNYPNLVALFENLGVPTKPTEMSFAASLNDGSLEYSGTDFNGLFSQRRNMMSPRFLLMLRDLVRFYSQASKLADEPSLQYLALENFLRRERYSDAFVYDHLMPMGAAIWSTSIEKMLSFPTLAFLRFFRNHGLLQLTRRPEWRTVDGGSREYVRRLTKGFAKRIRCGDPITSVMRNDDMTTILTAGGQKHAYDHVILACHADQALKLIANPSDAEQDMLGKIQYQANRAVLHSDTSMMPKRRRAWASWNYIGTSGAERSLCVTYWMNLLQGLPTSTPVLLTLNPNKDIDPTKILRTCNYEHPLFDAAAMQAQSHLWDLQGRQNTWFCGAYFGSGFHEDGIQAGLAVAEKLGGRSRPWDLLAPSSRIGLSKEGNRLSIGEVLTA
jgi:predicted NAD/FAD-binding protein